MSIGTHPLYPYLERAFAVETALPVARAALGLLVVLRAWVKRGHAPVVALCANVCHDVVAAVAGAGCRPVFLDLDPTTGVVPGSQWVRGRESGASVALVVHLYGNPADVAAARHAFPQGECLVIDDAAQALGARHHDLAAGGQGDVGLLSFGPTKQVEGGGGVVLLHSLALAADVAAELSAVDAADEATRSQILTQFRRGLEMARGDLRQGGSTAAFAGLLDGYTPALVPAFPDGSSEIVLASLQGYEPSRLSRIDKARLWADLLADAGFEPVGMGDGSVPWRFTCRLPGIDWATQHRMAEAMRQRGVNVSHWYLPAHWLFGEPAASLPGSEQLSREIFQFWVDASTSEVTIRQQAPVVVAAAQEQRE